MTASGSDAASVAVRPLPGASAASIRAHYDHPDAFFRLFLGDTMCYSAALFERGEPLSIAQLAKIDFHLAAAEVCAGSRLVDIGCGWGALLRRALDERRAAHAVGLTLSHTQATAIRAWRDERIEVREEHWAAHRPAERYDAAVCVGAMEHFATPDASERDRLEIYRRFFARVHDWLKAGASLSLQCIVRGQDSTRPDLLAENGTFPESSLPHLWEIVAASRNTFELRSLVNRRDDYIETLSHWIRGLKASRSAAEALIGRDQTQAFLDYLRYSRMGFSLQRTELVRATFRARPRLNHGAGDEHAR